MSRKSRQPLLPAFFSQPLNCKLILTIAKPTACHAAGLVRKCVATRPRCRLRRRASAGAALQVMRENLTTHAPPAQRASPPYWTPTSTGQTCLSTHTPMVDVAYVCVRAACLRTRVPFATIAPVPSVCTASWTAGVALRSACTWSCATARAKRPRRGLPRRDATCVHVMSCRLVFFLSNNGTMSTFPRPRARAVRSRCLMSR